jgi:hypothetical protein
LLFSCPLLLLLLLLLLAAGRSELAEGEGRNR